MNLPQNNSPTRRKFIQTTAATASVVAGSNTVAVAETQTLRPSKNMNVDVLVCGAGCAGSAAALAASRAGQR